MYELIVLGIVPGTAIQITFGIWLAAISAVAEAYLLIRLFRVHRRHQQTLPADAAEVDPLSAGVRGHQRLAVQLQLFKQVFLFAGEVALGELLQAGEVAAEPPLLFPAVEPVR